MIFKVLTFLSFTLVTINAFWYEDAQYLAVIKTDKNFLNYYHPWYNQTINYLETLSNSQQVRSQCRSSLKRWIVGIENREAWALKFLESTGKTVNGKLTGHNVNFGSFNYCTLFRKDEKKKIDFDGKFCMMSLQNQETQITRNKENYLKQYALYSERSKRLIDFSVGNGHGVCMPSTCDVNELTAVTNDILKTINFELIPPKRCTTISEPEPWTPLQIISLTIILLFISLCLLASFVQNEFLSCFSIVHNFNIIYNFERDEKASESAWTHGLKAYLIFLSLLAHSLFMGSLYWSPPWAQVKEFENAVSGKVSQLFAGRVLAFPGQLFLSGGFFAFVAWFDALKEKKIKYNFFIFVIVRYIRIVAIAVPILLIYFILPHLGSGPMYSDLTGHLYENCKANGYKIFLLTTNLNDRGIDMCNLGNWYLSADFQLYLVSYFLIYYLITKPKIGLVIAAVQIVLSSLATIAYFEWYNFDFFQNTWPTSIFEITRFQDVYLPSFLHHNTYVFAALAACAYKHNIKPKIIDYKIVRIFGLVFVLLLTFCYVYWYPHHIEKTNAIPNIFLQKLYPILDKFLMSLIHIWIFYLVGIGYFTGLKKILSLKIWLPISRLAFSISLSQFIYITYSFSMIRSSYSMSLEALIYEFVMKILFTLLLSNFIFLFMEGPLIALAKKYSGVQKRHEESLSKKLK